MKKKFLLFGALVGALLLSSCSGGSKKQTVSQLVPRLRGILARVTALRPCQAGELRAFRYAAEDLAGVLRVGLEGFDNGVLGIGCDLARLDERVGETYRFDGHGVLLLLPEPGDFRFGRLLRGLEAGDLLVFGRDGRDDRCAEAASSIWPLLLPRATIASADKLIFSICS